MWVSWIYIRDWINESNKTRRQNIKLDIKSKTGRKT